ncbi:hypothetical protein GQ473_02800, partial [archaeon]|nr:hypothetical protein [archaeon]
MSEDRFLVGEYVDDSNSRDLIDSFYGKNNSITENLEYFVINDFYLLNSIGVLNSGMVKSFSLKESEIGYEYANNTYNLWNNYDDYYINLTEGIQATNHEGQYWGYTKYCVNLKTTEWYQYCTDVGEWEWSAITDNETYTTLKGSSIINESGNEIKFTLEYYLKMNWSEILITPTVTNLGNTNYFNSEIIITNYDIRINTTYENDVLEIPLVLESNTYNLSDSELSLFFDQDNLTERKFELWDISEQQFARTRWNESYFMNGQESSMDYTLNITHISEWYNAPVILTLKTGILNKQNQIITNLWWIDAKAGPNTFDSDPYEVPDPINVENTITFYGTATSAESYTYRLTICDSSTTDYDCSSGVGTCTGGSKICESASLAASGTQTSCTHDTTGESGDVSWIAYTCNSNSNLAGPNSVESPYNVITIIQPKTNNTSVNETQIYINNTICVNHTITIGNYPINNTWIEITYSNGTSANISTSNSTGVCGAGENVYGSEIDVGPTTGIFTVNTSWVNDSQGNIDYDDPYPNQKVIVYSYAPDNIISRIYKDESYLDVDIFFTKTEIIYLKANITNSIGNITDANVTVEIFNSTLDLIDTINLTHIGGSSSIYYGNWTSQITDIPDIYTIKVNATNSYGSLSENTTLHLYSGLNISGYKLDYDNDNIQEYIIENENLIVIYNGTINRTHPIIYFENKNLNESYNISQLSDNTLFGLGDIIIENMMDVKYTSLSFSQEGENLDNISLEMVIESQYVENNPTEETIQNDDGGASTLYPDRFVGDIIASKFTASTTNYPYKIMSTDIQLYDSNAIGATVYTIHIYDDNGGVPGNDLIDPFNVTITSFYTNWYTVDLSSYNIEITSGNFWIGVELTEDTGNDATGGPFFLDDGSASVPSNSYFDFGSGWEVQA